MGARVLIVIACLAACTKRSEKYCKNYPEDLAFCERSDAAIDGPISCTSNDMCTPADPICEPGSHICVECLTSTDCKDPTQPNCDPVTFACQGCVTHADCASNACLPDGVCGGDDTVIFVAEAGNDTAPCTSAAPCKTIAHAITLLTDKRRTIKLSGHLVESVTIASKHGTFIADPGTTLTGTADPTIKFQMSEIKMYDLAITCPAAPAIEGIKSEMSSTTTLVRVSITGCGKLGLEAKGGYLRLNRSTIAKNFAGGIVTDASADFSMTNNFIYLNGNPTSPPGGVKIGAMTSGANQFEFNTVADNTSKDSAGGVSCVVTNFLAANNNLIVANTGIAATPNTVGCDFSKSIVDTDVAPYGFVGAENYHITATSAAIDAATAPSVVIDDVDGQYRPLGSAKDVGADEYKP